MKPSRVNNTPKTLRLNNFPSSLTPKVNVPSRFSPFNKSSRFKNSDPAGSGKKSSSGSDKISDDFVVQKNEAFDKSKRFNEGFERYNKKKSDDQCEMSQEFKHNKARVNELPDSSKFMYSLRPKRAKLC